MSKVLGAIVIARNGDRQTYHQDPKTYAGSFTETTALGEVGHLCAALFGLRPSCRFNRIN